MDFGQNQDFRNHDFGWVAKDCKSGMNFRKKPSDLLRVWVFLCDPLESVGFFLCVCVCVFFLT